jgi:hypothetical protein
LISSNVTGINQQDIKKRRKGGHVKRQFRKWGSRAKGSEHCGIEAMAALNEET